MSNITRRRRDGSGFHKVVPAGFQMVLRKAVVVLLSSNGLA